MRDNYKYVSLIYDDFISNLIDYKFWAKYIYQLIKKFSLSKNYVLEIASGNCNLSRYLHKKFPNYVVSDLSLSMLKNCKVNTKLKVCCDMLQLPFKKKFDIILCSFDSINYILSKKKLSLFFKEIYKTLNDDGLFIFDAALIKNSYHHQKYALKQKKVKNIIIKRESIFIPKSRLHKNIFNFYLPNGIKVKEIHKQKIYDLYELFEIIDKNRFIISACYNAFTFDDCKPYNLRAQFVIKRIS